ncbi:MAG: hypothetical protein A2046_08485 [Bacteroidetes bacterium GWA2_30_7]|nr:MAG: hypothetical protein A2046_08485 [Bacteroidetes bacterium GWA2_30_7]
MFVKIQTLIFNIVNTILTLVKILILSDLFISKNKIKSDSKECVILGNGPSLNCFISDNKNFLENKELMCVNHFAETDYYTNYKPRFYVINAIELWSNNVEQSHKDRSDKLFGTIAEKTTWELFLFVHASAKKYKRWSINIEKNSNIKIVYYNPTPVDGFRFFKYYCYTNNLGMPRPHNVLIPGILSAINSGFTTIYIAGADHSWFKDLWVNENNEVLLTQKHFYDEKTAQALPVHKEGKGQRKLHEILIKWVYSFQSYWEMENYSKHIGVKIYNVTKESFVDAFERIRV